MGHCLSRRLSRSERVVNSIMFQEVIHACAFPRLMNKSCRLFGNFSPYQFSLSDECQMYFTLLPTNTGQKNKKAETTKIVDCPAWSQTQTSAYNGKYINIEFALRKAIVFSFRIESL